MSKFFYTIIIIVTFIILVFVMNIMLQGGDQAVRAIYRFAGDNPRVGEISKAYRHTLLGGGSDGKLLDKKNQKSGGVIIETSNTFNQLPRDPKIGNILDTTLTNFQTSGVSGRTVISLLAQALDVPVDEFTRMYERITSVSDITRLSPAEQENPLMVEIFVRRDRIKTQAAEHLASDDTDMLQAADTTDHIVVPVNNNISNNEQDNQ